MPLCFGSAFRKTCNLTIWTSGAPRKAFQEHKPKVNIFRWLLHYMVPFTSADKKEDNSTNRKGG